MLPQDPKLVGQGLEKVDGEVVDTQHDEYTTAFGRALCQASNKQS